MAQLVTILSPNFTVATRGRDPDLIVFHSTENESVPGVALNIGHFFESRSVKASAHRVFDDVFRVYGVKDEDIAWAAPGANQDGLQYELVGRAAWSRDQWLAHRATLDNAAEQAADHMRKYPRIRPVWLDADALKRGERGGLTWHHAVSDAFHQSDHSDPNNGHGIDKGFPFDVQLDLIHQHLGNAPQEEDVTEAQIVELVWKTVDGIKQQNLDKTPFLNSIVAALVPYVSAGVVNELRAQGVIK